MAVMETNKQIKLFIHGNEKLTVPFNLSIEDEIYRCTEVLRLLPGKRLVVKVLHRNGQLLLIKLFAISKKGERELAREKKGYQLAMAAQVNVPTLLFTKENVSECCVIAYQYLENAEPFTNKKKTLSLYDDKLLYIAAMLHKSGAIQADFHLGNILIYNEKLYLIDLATVESKSLDKQASLANLAMLFAQFKPKQQQIMINRLQQYYRYRDWSYNATEITVFNTYLYKAWQKRKINNISKRFRNCTMTAYKKTFAQQYAFRRSFFEKAGEAFINDIDALVSNGKILKAGNSATVVQVDYAGKKLVIKRYNIKSFWHLLKRCCLPSRAAVSWRNANLLRLLGIATPKPIGFIEQRFGFFRTTAYLVCELSDGQQLATVFKYREPTMGELAQLKNIFQIFNTYHISHGDFKATNLLINKKGKIQLIDLDAMQQHTSLKSFQQSFNKDKARFLRNWSSAKVRAIFTQQVFEKTEDNIFK